MDEMVRRIRFYQLLRFYMTEQEILAELAANDQKVIRAAVEKLTMGTDDSYLIVYNERQAELRKMLVEVRNAAAN